MAAQFFTFCGYKTLAAESCTSALTLFERHRIDCVLIDYNLLDFPADVFCSKIRSTEKLVHTPIIVISGEEAREAQAYTTCQADYFLLRTVPFEKMRTIIESLMRRVYWDRGIVCEGDLRLERIGFKVFRNNKLTTRLTQDQFNLLYLLILETPNPLTEDALAKHLYNSDFAPDHSEAIRGILCRLRQRLGAQLSRRVVNEGPLKWSYQPPRSRRNRTPRQQSNHSIAQ